MDGFEGLLDALATHEGHGAASVEFLFGGSKISFTVTKTTGVKFGACFDREQLRGLPYSTIYQMVMGGLEEIIDV